MGGIPDFTLCYVDVEEKWRLQLKVKELLHEALNLPGVFPDFGVVVEAAAFGGQIMWFKDGAPFTHPCLKDVKDIDTLEAPKPGQTGFTAPVLVQAKVMSQKLKAQGNEIEKWAVSVGPTEISELLLGYDKYYLGLYDDPKRLTTLMEMVNEFVSKWIKEQGKAVGKAEVSDKKALFQDLTIGKFSL